MIIWRGLGFLVVVIVFGSSLAANLITNRVTNGETYWKERGWPFATSLLVSAAIVFVIAVLRSRGAVERRDDLFFVPMKWWGPMLAIIGIALLFSNWSPG